MKNSKRANPVIQEALQIVLNRPGMTQKKFAKKSRVPLATVNTAAKYGLMSPKSEYKIAVAIEKINHPK